MIGEINHHGCAMVTIWKLFNINGSRRISYVQKWRIGRWNRMLRECWFVSSIWTTGEGLCTLFPSNRHWMKYFIYKFWGDYATMCAASRRSMAVGPSGSSVMTIGLLAQPSRHVNFWRKSIWCSCPYSLDLVPCDLFSFIQIKKERRQIKNAGSAGGYLKKSKKIRTMEKIPNKRINSDE